MFEVLNCNYGDGVEASARAERGVIMMVDAAIGRLISLGYDRDKDKIAIDLDTGDPFPIIVLLDGKRMFEVTMHSSPGEEDSMNVVISGKWINKPKGRSWWHRLKFW